MFASLSISRASLVAQLVKDPSAMWETWVLPLGWEDPLENGKTTHPPQYSGLENSTDCIVHGVAKSRARLSDFHFHFTVTQKPHTHTYFVLIYLYATIFQVGPSEDLQKYWQKVNKRFGYPGKENVEFLSL